MIRELKELDIEGLNNLPPSEWKFDYEALVEDFIKEDFFMPLSKLKTTEL